MEIENNVTQKVEFTSDEKIIIAQKLLESMTKDEIYETLSILCVHCLDFKYKDVTCYCCYDE